MLLQDIKNFLYLLEGPEYALAPQGCLGLLNLTGLRQGWRPRHGPGSKHVETLPLTQTHSTGSPWRLITTTTRPVQADRGCVRRAISGTAAKTTNATSNAKIEPSSFMAVAHPPSQAPPAIGARRYFSSGARGGSEPPKSRGRSRSRRTGTYSTDGRPALPCGRVLILYHDCGRSEITTRVPARERHSVQTALPLFP
jgi:hypothetical protein